MDFCDDSSLLLSRGAVVLEVISGSAAVGACLGGCALPHCGQKSATSRIDAPQVGQRRAISGSLIVKNFGLRISDFGFEKSAISSN
jgi:hypothetical protein